MRSLSDLQALALAELNGTERRGTVVAELTGGGYPADQDVSAALLKLAEKLSAPGGVLKQIKDLSAAADAARTEKAALVKLRLDTEADLASAHAKHTATIERELADHEKAMSAARAELAIVEKQSANLMAKAKADADAAAKLKATAERKLRAFDAA